MQATRTAQSPPAAVLDTNVVLDWLLFRDPRAAALGAAVQRGQLRWLVCPRMREEFARTLGSAVLSRWQPDSATLLARFDAMACMLPPPPASPLRLRCDDPDDQVFVDLALAAGASWLLSHDKALLRLRRRVPPGGPLICRPDDWSPP
jgi:predicted nucleic acid-binding protein